METGLERGVGSNPTSRPFLIILMDADYFRELFALSEANNERHPSLATGDDVFLGLQIVARYLPTKVVVAAEHDYIYSARIDELAEAGITAEEVIELAQLGWSIEDHDALGHHV